MTQPPRIYEKEILVNSRDVDGAGECKASALLAYMQDVSAEHTTLCGCGRKELLARYHVFWMLTRVQLRLERPIRWLEKLTVRTGHRAARGMLLFRDYEFWTGEELAGSACALWVLPDLTTRRLLNTATTPLPELNAAAGGLTPRIRSLPALHAPENLSHLEERLIRYSDTDVNGHVNNTKYADFVCDALHFEDRPQGAFLSGLEITYHEECRAGETLTLSADTGEDSSFVHGVGADGKAKFDARVRLSTPAIS